MGDSGEHGSKSVGYDAVIAVAYGGAEGFAQGDIAHGGVCVSVGVEDIAASLPVVFGEGEDLQ